MLRVAKTSYLVGAALYLVSACNSGVSTEDSAALFADEDVARVHAWASPPPKSVAEAPKQTESLDSVSTLLTGLEARLREAPNDLKGWSLLAQSYAFVGRMEEAYSAIDRAVALGADRVPLERRVRAAHGDGG